MPNDKRKVALIGTGMVGMSYAYTLINQAVCDELVLIDLNKEKAIGEAMDLNHGTAFAPGRIRIYAGDYTDCADADIAVISAGVPQKDGQTRLDLLNENAKVFGSIIKEILRSGFNGIFLVASNPVDIMTRITYELSGFNPARVIGTGTTLDTARLRFLVGEYFEVDPRNVHAYVIGEHGDSEFVPWSQALIATKPVTAICENDKRYSIEHLETLTEEVRGAAYKIIKAKRATYYGIGMALCRITKAIFGNEHSVLTLSTLLRGEYGERNVYAGVPCIVGREGIRDVIELKLNKEEKDKFSASCNLLRDTFNGIEL